MNTVAGIFDSRAAADRAVFSLVSAGIADGDISLIMSDKTHSKLFNSTDDEAERVAKGGAAGAALGGVAGALVAGLVVVGTITMPGAALLAAGPLAAILSGAGAGAVIGGLSGALVHAGFAADEANRYEEAVNQGKTVIVVHPKNDKQEAAARAVFYDAHASVQAA